MLRNWELISALSTKEYLCYKRFTLLYEEGIEENKYMCRESGWDITEVVYVWR